MIPDACPVCPPGIPDAALPRPDGTYTCPSCGQRWHTQRDRYGWPLERRAAA